MKASRNILATFGINGSLHKREVSNPQQNTEYYLFNSQANLKAYSDDVMSFAYYGYNAANTRTYKLSLYNTNLWINGQQQPLNLQWQNAMFYPNTYLNFNQNGEYTKHYYNGMERVASRLGDNNTTIAIDNMLENRKLLLEEQVRNDIQELISEPTQVDMPPMLDILNLQLTGTPNDIYYYHPNHLGSTSFVTDQNQTITQGFLYAPYGEITTEYNINFGNNTIPKYSFNAKELDEETGMFYYEARYYAPPTFTSRDPMFEKYFWMSPYAYCANNPVKYVDPSGEEMWHPDGEGNLIADEGDDYNTLKTYLVNIYGDEDKISTEEWESFSSQINSAIGANGAAEIAGMKLTSENGTFENLVGKFLVARFNEDKNWGLPQNPNHRQCSPTTFNRINLATKFVYGKKLLGAFSMSNPIYKSWNFGSTDGIPAWGSPIISFLGLGKAVTDFQNDLKPGSIIGLQGHGGGHSAIFIRYSEDGKGFYEWGHCGEHYRTFDDIKNDYGKKIERGTNFY